MRVPAVFFLAIVALMSGITISNAAIINGEYWQIALNMSNTAAPYQPTVLQAVLQGCGSVSSFTNQKYLWVFGGARNDLGEEGRSITTSSTTTHEFRGTGRRTVTVTACVDDVGGGTSWCNGYTISNSFEILVQYVRKELRDLTDAEWNLWVDAMWKIKTLSQDELHSRYGKFAKSYDWVTALHLKAVMNATCDQAHFWTAFHPAHRIFTRLIELSVQSIYPALALPYWDQTYDQEHYANPFIDSPIFGDKYFGGAGDPTKFYAVTNGRFAGPGKDWLIAQADQWLDPNQYRYSPFGYLRAAWNANPAPTFARIPNNYLGFQDVRGGIHWAPLAYQQQCLNGANYSEFHYCRDYPFEGPHPWPHVMLGGAINPTYGETSVGYPRDPRQFGLSTSRIIFAASIFFAGVATCPVTCAPGSVTMSNNSECLCACAPGPFSPPQMGFMTALAGKLGLPNNPPILDASDSRNMCSIGGIQGDMDDTTSSPNDPIFFFFHSDVDRAWYDWQVAHVDLGRYGDFPLQGFCPGHGLYDVLMGESGPTPDELDLGDETSPFTNAQVIERTLPPEFGIEEITPWRYEPFSQWNLPPKPAMSYLQPFPYAEYCSISAALLPTITTCLGLFFLFMAFATL
jgi:hypothetical protein